MAVAQDKRASELTAPVSIADTDTFPGYRPGTGGEPNLDIRASAGLIRAPILDGLATGGVPVAASGVVTAADAAYGRQAATLGAMFANVVRASMYGAEAVSAARSVQTALLDTGKYASIAALREACLTDSISGFNDDTAIAFTPIVASGTAYFRAGAHWVHFSYNTATPTLTITSSSSSAVTATTGVLAGTTGTDGKLTLSAHTDGKIYAENRTATGMVGYLSDVQPTDKVDYAALQTGICDICFNDRGGILQLDGGQYKLNRPIRPLDVSGGRTGHFAIMGESRKFYRSVLSPTGNNSLIAASSTNTFISMITLQWLNFDDAAGVATTAPLVDASNFSNSYINHCWFSRCAYAVKFDGVGSHVWLNGVQWENVDKAVYVKDFMGVYLKGCWVGRKVDGTPGALIWVDYRKVSSANASGSLATTVTIEDSNLEEAALLVDARGFQLTGGCVYKTAVTFGYRSSFCKFAPAQCNNGIYPVLDMGWENEISNIQSRNTGFWPPKSTTMKNTLAVTYQGRVPYTNGDADIVIEAVVWGNDGADVFDDDVRIRFFDDGTSGTPKLGQTVSLYGWPCDPNLSSGLQFKTGGNTYCEQQNLPVTHSSASTFRATPVTGTNRILVKAQYNLLGNGTLLNAAKNAVVTTGWGNTSLATSVVSSRCRLTSSASGRLTISPTLTVGASYRVDCRYVAGTATPYLRLASNAVLTDQAGEALMGATDGLDYDGTARRTALYFTASAAVMQIGIVFTAAGYCDIETISLVECERS